MECRSEFCWPVLALALCSLHRSRTSERASCFLQAVGDCRRHGRNSDGGESDHTALQQFSAVACGKVRSTTCFSDESHLMSCSSRLSNAVEILIVSSSATLPKEASVSYSSL